MTSKQKLKNLINEINTINGVEYDKLNSYILSYNKATNNRVYYSLLQVVSEDGDTISICQWLLYSELRYLLIGILYGWKVGANQMK